MLGKLGWLIALAIMSVALGGSYKQLRDYWTDDSRPFYFVLAWLCMLGFFAAYALCQIFFDAALVIRLEAN